MKKYSLKSSLLLLGILVFFACNSGSEEGDEILLVDNISFITIWKTDNEGVSNDNQIQIKAEGTNYTIKWQNIDDPSINGEETATNTHRITFPEPGTYQLSISGGSPAFSKIDFGPSGSASENDPKKILDVIQWGTTEWSSMESAFAFCENLTISASDTPNLNNVTSMFATFAFCRNLNSDLSDWDVSGVTTMRFMFQDATNFNRDISNWDVGSVTDMTSMFLRATSFNQDINNWNIGNVTTTRSMFVDATAFNQDISSWDVSNVFDISSMFAGATSFNQDINAWDVTGVNDMSRMFSGATSFNQNISAWDVSNINNMIEMFMGATAFNQDISSWDVSNVSACQDFALNSGLSPFNIPNFTQCAD